MLDSLFQWFWSLLYQIVSLIAYLMGILYNCFEIAAGLDTVTYEGSKTTLVQVVFGHSLINRAYWGMAIIGVALCFFFTILAVIRKMFDSSNQVKNSMGEILTQSLKSILLICSMSMLMNMALYFSTSLMDAVQLAFFSNTASATEEHPKTYTDSEYATMARILNTIGNYSLNPSYNSRYNINSCYNDIRNDLQSLEDQGTFNVQYRTPDLLNNSSHYWQASLQKIVNAAPDLSADVPIDVYNAALSEAIEDTMNEIRTNDQFQPLQEYADTLGNTSDEKIHLDRTVLLVGTFDAAINSKFNGNNASLTDTLRAPYYYGNEKHDVYKTDDMKKAFELKKYNFILILFISFVLAKNMAVIILNCVARIFNMAVLYIIAPPFIAVSPLDGGSKFKQWGIAFVAQCFGVFGTVIAMDLMVMFIPIIMSSQLQIFNNSIVNYFAKLLIIWAGFETARKANSIVTAILSDNGAMAAGAGDMAKESATLGRMASAMTGLSAAKWLGGAAMENVRRRVRKSLPFGKSSKDKKEGEGQNFVKVPGGSSEQTGSSQTTGGVAASSGGTGGNAGSGSSTGGGFGQTGSTGNAAESASDPQKVSAGEQDAGSSQMEEPAKVNEGEADAGPDQGSPETGSVGGLEPGASDGESGGSASGGEMPRKESQGEADSYGEDQNSDTSPIEGTRPRSKGVTSRTTNREQEPPKTRPRSNAVTSRTTNREQEPSKTRPRSNAVTGRTTNRQAKTPPPLRRQQPPRSESEDKR